MTLTKYEKETIILFNEGEDTAHIQTYNAGLRKRLAAFSKKHPDLCRLEKSFAQGGVIYVLDKSRLSIRVQRPKGLFYQFGAIWCQYVGFAFDVLSAAT